MKDTVQQIKKRELTKLDAAGKFAADFAKTMKGLVHLHALADWYRANQGRAGRSLSPQDFEATKAIVKTVNGFDRFVKEFGGKIEQTKQRINLVNETHPSSTVTSLAQRGPSMTEFQVYNRLDVRAKQILATLNIVIKAGKK